MTRFSELAASRRAWIDQVLTPWCRSATRQDLLLAEHEWTDVAGKVDPNKSLWYWAWGRFPDLVNAELMGIDETAAVTVTLDDGRTLTGYPDARESLHGELVLICRDPADSRRSVQEGPFPLDRIRSVVKSE
ncbi:MAG: hypothetical protein EHM42_15030 [Planctomycetaceae bacterium]|nr:MAG: hypothetical protein EHM42_15030 [Planctomycetaceae bacterium]